jgi:3-hydroxyisobutyrate dehydrogenase
VNLSSGRSNATEITIPQFVFGPRLDQDFSLGLMAKDVGIAYGLMAELSDSMPVSASVYGRLEDAVDVLGKDADVNRLVRLYEEAAKVTLAHEIPGNTD